MRDYLVEHRHVRLSREAIRQVLNEARISWQSTKTWKRSTDPEFVVRKDRIDEGLDFLGWRIQRHRKRGTAKHYVYTYPAKKALHAVMTKVKTLCGQNVNLSLEALLHQLNPVLRGWTTYFRPGVSSTAFNYLRAYTWRRVMSWLRREHRRTTWKQLRRRYCPDSWWPAIDTTRLFNPGAVTTTRYRYRGATIPSPWPSTV